jgi:MFS transporter, AAHS family, benzoate transport protein
MALSFPPERGLNKNPTKGDYMTTSTDSGAFLWLDELPFNRFHASTLALCCLVLAAAGFNLQILAYAMPLITREWSLTPVQGGAMVSYGFLGLMVGAIGFGLLADRFGRKKALVAAISVFALLGGAASLASGYRNFCILRFLTGVGVGGAFPLTVSLLAEFSPARTRGRLVAAAVSGFTFGWAIAASVSMALIPRFGWRPAFQLGLLALILLPALWTLLPESVRFLAGSGRPTEALREMARVERIAGLGHRNWTGTDMLPPAAESRQGIAQLFKGELALMTLLVWATYLLNTMALYGLSSWLPTLLVKEGFSLVKSYSYSMVQAGGSAVGGFVLGCAMDRFGRKQGLLVTYLLAGLSMALFGMVNTNVYLFIAGAATGVFVVGTPTALNVVSSEVYPTRVRSTGVASTQAVARVGSILGPMIGGLIQNLGFTFHQFFLLFAIPCFVCAFLVIFYPINVRDESLETVSSALGVAKAEGGGTA